ARFCAFWTYLPPNRGGLRFAQPTLRADHPLHKTIHHALLAGAVELNGQLVAVDRRDVAVAEFLMEDSVAERKRRHRAGRFGDQFAFDGEWHAFAFLLCSAAQRRIAPQRGEVMQFLVLIHVVARIVLGKAAGAALRIFRRLRALPAGRAVIGAERGGGVEPRRSVAAMAGEPAEAAMPPLRLGHLHIALRPLVEKARRYNGLPQPL